VQLLGQEGLTDSASFAAVDRAAAIVCPRRSGAPISR